MRGTALYRHNGYWVTLDERIADGFYFIRSMQVLQEYLANPERLLERPEILHLAPLKRDEAPQEAGTQRGKEAP